MNDCLLILNLCYGTTRNYSPMRCNEFYDICNNIIKISQNYSFCFVANDHHDEDDYEFNYLPKHNLGYKIDVAHLFHIEEKIKSKYIQHLSKKNFSAIKSEHNKELILSSNFDNITVAGFLGCTDLIPTCLDLMQNEQKVQVFPSCVGDISKEHKELALKYLSLFNIIKDEI